MLPPVFRLANQRRLDEIARLIREQDAEDVNNAAARPDATAKVTVDALSAAAEGVDVSAEDADTVVAAPGIADENADATTAALDVAAGATVDAPSAAAEGADVNAETADTAAAAHGTAAEKDEPLALHQTPLRKTPAPSPTPPTWSHTLPTKRPTSSTRRPTSSSREHQYQKLPRRRWNRRAECPMHPRHDSRLASQRWRRRKKERVERK
eukprot:4380768-Pleurochrysis_carterae.AAC.4